jgi:DNA-binding winged helix-turn-helix (wHTH) protein
MTLCPRYFLSSKFRLSITHRKSLAFATETFLKLVLELDTLPKQGYRFVGDVVRQVEPVSAALASFAVSTQTGSYG